MKIVMKCNLLNNASILMHTTVYVANLLKTCSVLNYIVTSAYMLLYFRNL